MTATLPPHSFHYPQSSHQAYGFNFASYPVNNSLPTASSRLPTSYSFPENTPSASRNSVNSSSSRQLPLPPIMQTSQSATTLSRKRDRLPDWDNFYKNGPPKEIIVIDDDSPPPNPEKAIDSVNYPARGTVRGGPVEHANKKRKTGQASAYGSTRDYHTSNANARNYSHVESPSNTISTDRTTSIHTTAPTSLGSHTSHGSSGGYLEDGVIGQKRKRVTRQQIADEKRRQEVEIAEDAYSLYHPPPKPPIKAKDLTVPHMGDVRLIKHNA